LEVGIGKYYTVGPKVNSLPYVVNGDPLKTEIYEVHNGIFIW